MASKGRRPTEEKKPKTTWDVARVEDGEKFLAWVAGPAIRVKVHKAQLVKCCLREHAGATDCDGCRKNQETMWVAYLPVYREPDKHELVCSFGQSQWDNIDKLTLHQGVVIGREYPTGRLKAFKCGLWINPRSTKDKYETTDPVRQKDRCIAAWLPVLWKYVGRITGAQLLDEGTITEMLVPEPEPVAGLSEAEQTELAVELTRRKLLKDFKPLPEVPLSKAVSEALHRKVGHLSSNGSHK